VVKNIPIPEFNTGDIIKATAVDAPFVYHSGIILVENERLMIVHNTPMRKNKVGGNVVIESLDDFVAAGRKIVSRKPTGLSYEWIMASIEAVKKIPFNPLHFDCNDFVYYVRAGKWRRSRFGLIDNLIKGFPPVGIKIRRKR